MTFSELLAPAIDLAREGFPISEYFADSLIEFAGKLHKYPATARIYHGRQPQTFFATRTLHAHSKRWWLPRNAAV